MISYTRKFKPANTRTPAPDGCATAGACLGLLLWLAASAGFLYAAAHFIRKFW